MQQPQITTSTQGCNTVININIDSNSFNGNATRNNRNQVVETDPASMLTNQQLGQATALNHKNNSTHKTTKTRQSSSKMKRNDSISSNKSRKLGNNMRSDSGSQMRQQNISQYQNLSQMTYLSYNQPFVKNQTPKSNADIIKNNIAKINQKLNQQEAVSYTNGQNLQITINRIPDSGPLSLNTSGNIKLPKSKVKTKDQHAVETPVLKATNNLFQINNKDISLNQHIFN